MQMVIFYFSHFFKKNSSKLRIEEILKICSCKVYVDENLLQFYRFYILYIFSYVLFSFSIYKVPISFVDIVNDFTTLGRCN